MLWFIFDQANIFGIQFYYHPMFISSLLVIIGYQVIIFALFAKSYAVTHLGEQSNFMNSIYRHVSIEKAGTAGIFLIIFGLSIFFFIFYKWYRSHFGPLEEVKASIAAMTMITLGIQTFFSSFMLSILGIKED